MNMNHIFAASSQILFDNLAPNASIGILLNSSDKLFDDVVCGLLLEESAVLMLFIDKVDPRDSIVEGSVELFVPVE